MGRFVWAIKQLLPLTYVSDYTENGCRYVSVWKMWMGKTYRHQKWMVSDGGKVGS